MNLNWGFLFSTHEDCFPINELLIINYFRLIKAREISNNL